MTLEQRGAYHEMLCVSWQIGPLPDDPSLLTRLLGVDLETFERVWVEPLSSCWEKSELGLVNARLEDERCWAEARQKKAKKAANAKWENVRAQSTSNATGEQAVEHCPAATIQNQIQIQNQTKDPDTKKQPSNSKDRGTKNSTAAARQASNGSGWKVPERKPDDKAWFLVSGAFEWEPSFEKELEERFPAYTRKLKTKGMSGGDLLHELSVWHESAPRSKRKRKSAYRWLLQLCKKRNGEALHAENWRKETGTPLKQARASPKEPKMYESLRRLGKEGKQIGD